MTDDEPSRRRIAVEILVYAAVVIAVGAAIVAARVARDGPGVLHFDPRRAQEPADDRTENRAPR